VKAIILSAGQGSRLLPQTEEFPKCLLTLDDETTILSWQLSQLQKAGIKEAVVVSGYQAEKVEAELARHSLPTRTIYNPFYKVADNLGSVWMARSEFADDFILLNGDSLFVDAVPARLQRNAEKDAITITISRKQDFDDDDMKVVESGGRLLEIGKRLQRNDVNAEAIGMIAFRGNGARVFRETVEAEMRHQYSLKNYYLSIIDDLAKHEIIGVCEAEQEEWCEVDFPADLEHAREVFKIWQSRA